MIEVKPAIPPKSPFPAAQTDLRRGSRQQCRRTSQDALQSGRWARRMLATPALTLLAAGYIVPSPGITFKGFADDLL
jgi:hypothetical protein